MKRQALSRRTLLRGAGSIAIALPYLEAMFAYGQTVSFPKRFVGVANFDGTHKPLWTPSGTETAFTFGKILEPLNPYKSKLLVLEGIDNQVAPKGPAGSFHGGGISSLLSGAFTQTGSVFCGGGGGCIGWGGGITIDQYIGKNTGKGDRFPCLALALIPDNKGTQSVLSYSGPGAPVYGIKSPNDVFTKLFTGFVPPAGGGPAPGPDPLAPLRAQRKSVLDSTLASLNSLHAKLGASDRKKLDAHATSIREVEVQLTTPPEGPPATAVGCSKPAAPATTNWDSASNFNLGSKLMIDMLVMGLACQMTRSVSLQWGRSVGGLTFPWLGISGGQHEISHTQTADGQAKITTINNWFAQQYAYLISKMDAINEGGPTLLDNSVVFWGNSMSRGDPHTNVALPLVVAGGSNCKNAAGKGLRTGRFLKYGGGSHNDLLVSMLNAVGCPVNTFGEASYCHGPLANLT